MKNAEHITTGTLTEHELMNARIAIHEILQQAETGRIDIDFLWRKLGSFDQLLEKVKDQQKQHKKEAHLEMLYSVSRMLGASLDPHTVLDHAMQGIVKLTRAERSYIVLKNEDGEFDVRASYNFDEKSLTGSDIGFSHSIVDQVLEQGEPILTSNAKEDDRFAKFNSVMRFSLRSVMVVPLKVRDNIIGAIYVDNRDLTDLFDQDDRMALDALAKQIAVAIENAQLYADTDQALIRRVEELNRLRELDLKMSGSLDIQLTMQYAIEASCQVGQIHTAHLGLITELGVIAEKHYGIEDGDTKPIFLDRAFKIVGEVIAQNRSITRHLISEKISVLCVPIRTPKHMIGVIILTRSSAFSDDDILWVERVAQRAAIAIDNANLYSQALKADQTKTEFVSLVAHDLKVPMTTILGYADLAKSTDGLPSEIKDFMQSIIDTVRRMEMLVSDIADISQIESGHFVINKSKLDVDKVLTGLRKSLKAHLHATQLRERQQTYIEEIEPHLPPIRTDYYRLLQVLTNLLSNAYKYTPAGGTITLSAKLKEKAIEFTVADTGVGMCKADVARIGTKFWRADDMFTREQTGAGLGFAIARSLTKQMGSNIHIESEPGKGSKFSFSIPIDET